MNPETGFIPSRGENIFNRIKYTSWRGRLVPMLKYRGEKNISYRIEYTSKKHGIIEKMPPQDFRENAPPPRYYSGILS